MIDRSGRVIVTGAAGMVGRALAAKLQKEGFKNLFLLTRGECDLEDAAQVDRVFADIRPDYVFHIAAKVGGIKANMSDPVGFLRSNLLSQVYVLDACHKFGAKKSLLLGSSCIYPRECPQPMKEEYLMTGPLEPTNEGYALAKVAGLKLAQYYYQQYGMKVVCPMPCNIYGPGDTFDLERSHVLSALVRRFVDAKESGAPSVTLWGTGSARREFIYIDDVADGILHIMDHVETPDIVNLGTGVDSSIAELATLVANLVGYEGQLEWDKTKPDGMPRKCLDVSKLNEIGFRAKTSLEQGIPRVINEYREVLSSSKGQK